MATQTAPAFPIHLLDVETYNRMVASGALEGESVELLEGFLVEMMSPHSTDHAAVIEELTRHFAAAQARLRAQLPLEVPPNSMPEPDLALVAAKPPPGSHPHTALLVVEVSVSSHRIDRDEKARLYAKAEIPTYWLVDVPGKVIEVRTEPGPGGYGRCEIYSTGMTVPAPDPGVADLDVGGLLDDIGG
jgi:Uma2 family endonuclease